jgi:hypothetical protein
VGGGVLFSNRCADKAAASNLAPEVERPKEVSQQFY